MGVKLCCKTVLLLGFHFTFYIFLFIFLLFSQLNIFTESNKSFPKHKWAEKSVCLYVRYIFFYILARGIEGVLVKNRWIINVFIYVSSSFCHKYLFKLFVVVFNLRFIVIFFIFFHELKYIYRVSERERDVWWKYLGYIYIWI